MSTSILNTPVNTASAEEIVDLEREYLLQNYGRYPLVLDHGNGAWLWDIAGRKYLDFHRRHRRQRSGPQPSADYGK